MSKSKIHINNNLNEVNITDNIYLIQGCRTPTVEAWYKIANENLKSANILLENKCFSHAIFFIQQCVECIVKGVFLMSGILNADKIKDISHNPSDAFKQLYETIGYEKGIEYCQQIPDMLAKKSSFEGKMILGVSLANQFTTAYENVQSQFKNNLPSDTSTLESYVEDYVINTKFYYQNILLLFSCLFTHEVESSARYFTETNNQINFPNHIFSTKKISETLPTFIRPLSYLIDYFAGN